MRRGPRCPSSSRPAAHRFPRGESSGAATGTFTGPRRPTIRRGMAREFVKWDYELRNFAQIETVVDRALAMAQTEPPGPVYLTLPREVLAERHETFEYAEPSRLQKPGLSARTRRHRRRGAGPRRRAQPDHHHQGDGARSPRGARAGEARGDAGRAGLPGSRPQLHELSRRPSAARGLRCLPAHLEEVDVILVVEADAPWYPHIKSPRPETRVIQVASDPLFSGYPIRGFPSDLTLGGAPRPDTRGPRRGRGPASSTPSTRSPSGVAAGTPSTRACGRPGPRARWRSRRMRRST